MAVNSQQNRNNCSEVVIIDVTQDILRKKNDLANLPSKRFHVTHGQIILVTF